MDEIRQRLRRLPALTYVLARLTLWVVVPWAALYVLLFGAQRFLTDQLALDDDTPYIEPSPGLRWDDIDEVIVDDRDSPSCSMPCRRFTRLGAQTQLMSRLSTGQVTCLRSSMAC